MEKREEGEPEEWYPPPPLPVSQHLGPGLRLSQASQALWPRSRVEIAACLT